MDRRQQLRETREQTEKLDKVVNQLTLIQTLINNMGGVGPGTPLGEILNLLRIHLPEIAAGSAGGAGGTSLQMPMTDWMR